MPASLAALTSSSTGETVDGGDHDRLRRGQSRPASALPVSAWTRLAGLFVRAGPAGSLAMPQ
jgi:hypothetical protein